VLKKVYDWLPDFATTQVIADFEEAATAAVHAVFGSNVLVSQCWFHYCQVVGPHQNVCKRSAELMRPKMRKRCKPWFVV